MTLNDYFDRIVCINLDRRPDRWARCEALFKRHGLSVDRVAAVDGQALIGREESFTIPLGSVGCLLSHRRIQKALLASSHERVLIFEDDIDFIPDLQTRFAQLAPHVPAWDLLYLGGTHAERPQGVQGAPGLVRLRKAFSTSQYAITRWMAGVALEETRNLATTNKMDVTLASFQPWVNAYGFVPPLAWQRPGYSDIQGREVDYRGTRSAGKKQ